MVWQAETLSMNPTIGMAVIAESYETDETVAAAEYGACSGPPTPLLSC